jgi:hypothetical protein
VTAGVFAANAIGHSFAQPTPGVLQPNRRRWQKPLCLPCRAEAGIASAESRPLVSGRCDPLSSARHYSSTQIGADSCDAGGDPPVKERIRTRKGCCLSSPHAGQLSRDHRHHRPDGHRELDAGHDNQLLAAIMTRSPGTTELNIGILPRDLRFASKALSRSPSSTAPIQAGGRAFASRGCANCHAGPWAAGAASPLRKVPTQRRHRFGSISFLT